MVSSSPEERRQKREEKDKYTLGLREETESLELRRTGDGGEGDGASRVGGIIPTEPASPTSRTYLFFIACTRLPLFHPALPFSHSSFLILLSLSFFTLHIPPLSLPEALSSELPRFFIKELSLKPSNYYGERERWRWGSEGASVFHWHHLLHCTLCHTCSTVLTISPSYSEGKEVQGIFSVSLSVCPIPSIFVFLSLPTPLLPLSQVKC